MLPVYGEAIHLLVSFLDSDSSKEALSITEFFSRETHNSSRVVAYGILPSIFRILDSKSSEHHIISLKKLCNLSSNNDICQHIVYLKLHLEIGSISGQPNLVGYSIKVIKNFAISRRGELQLLKQMNSEVTS